MVVEEVLSVSVPLSAQALDVKSVERLVKKRKGEDWHVDWARFLNEKSAYNTVGETQAPAGSKIVLLPVYKYTYEGASHE